jgi:hypothetical protein
MSQEIDDFEEMEDLLSSAQRHSKKMRDRSILRRTARSREEVSQDYAERLAEKAVFRRLLSDEALDGVRFRWLFSNEMIPRYTDERTSLDSFRKWIDSMIAEEGETRGPSA